MSYRARFPSLALPAPIATRLAAGALRDETMEYDSTARFVAGHVEAVEREGYATSLWASVFVYGDGAIQTALSSVWLSEVRHFTYTGPDAVAALRALDALRWMVGLRGGAPPRRRADLARVFRGAGPTPPQLVALDALAEQGCRVTFLAPDASTHRRLRRFGHPTALARVEACDAPLEHPVALGGGRELPWPLPTLADHPISQKYAWRLPDGAHLFLL